MVNIARKKFYEFVSTVGAPHTELISPGENEKDGFGLMRHTPNGMDRQAWEGMIP